MENSPTKPKSARRAHTSPSGVLCRKNCKSTEDWNYLIDQVNGFVSDLIYIFLLSINGTFIETDDIPRHKENLRKFLTNINSTKPQSQLPKQ